MGEFDLEESGFELSEEQHLEIIRLMVRSPGIVISVLTQVVSSDVLEEFVETLGLVKKRETAESLVLRLKSSGVKNEDIVEALSKRFEARKDG